MPETFKEYRARSEGERLSVSIENIRLLIHELYFERLLETEEASSFMQATSSIASQADLGSLEDRMVETGALSLSSFDKSDETIARLNMLRNVFVRQYQKQALENWKEVIRDFLQSIDTYNVGDNHRLVRAWISRLIEKAYYLTRNAGGEAKTFGTEVAMLLNSVRLPEALMRTDNIIGGKRQPSLIESIDSTIDHLEYVEGLPQAFGRTVDAMIVGGSLSYGPFFNIRSNIDATGSSDVDAIFIITPSFDTSSEWEGFMKSDLFTEEDKREFTDRREVFKCLQHEGIADIISQKFTVPGRDFVMSAHFFTPEVFEKMAVSGLERHLVDRSDSVDIIRDYKPRCFEHQVCPQRSFDGSIFNYVVPEQERVKRGYVVKLPGYILSNGSFFPGLYHNLISPEFSVFHDTSGTTRAIVRRFQSIMLAEADRMKESSPRAALALSHIRNDVFAPERYS